MINTYLNKISKHNSKQRRIRIDINKANINNEEKVKFINKIPYFTGFCWRVITKRKFLERKNIFFVDAHQYEDEDFFCKLIIYSKFITLTFFN